MKDMTDIIASTVQLAVGKIDEGYKRELISIFVRGFFEKVQNLEKTGPAVTERFNELENKVYKIISAKTSFEGMINSLIDTLPEIRNVVSFLAPGGGSTAVEYLEIFCKTINNRKDFESIAVAFAKNYWHFAY